MIPFTEAQNSLSVFLERLFCGLVLSGILCVRYIFYIRTLGIIQMIFKCFFTKRRVIIMKQKSLLPLDPLIPGV